MRVSVVGCPGSGKSTLARRAAEILDVPHHEIDAFYHQPGWVQKEHDLLRAELSDALDASEGWVVDGNYNSSVGDLVRGRSDVIVMFDLPRWKVIGQVARRTVRRAVTREVLWNGNREPLTNFTSWKPEKNVIRWAWVYYPHYQRKYRELAISSESAHADVVRIEHHDDGEAWLRALKGQTA